MPEVYEKVSALTVADQRMLLITATADPQVYSMPGGPMRGTYQTVTLAEDLGTELGVSLVGAELFGKYEVRSGIDGVLVRSWVYRVAVDGRPAPRQPGRSCVWADAATPVRVSTTVAVVLADAVAQGLVAGDSSW